MATRPYQGYPYSDPHVTDAPTVDAATASRWNNLPRRPIQPSRNVCAPEGSDVSRPNDEQTDKKEPEPVIYIDVPDGNSSDVASPRQPDPDPEHETIFYNPFDDRWIDEQKPDGTDSSSGTGPQLRPAPAAPRPTPPRTLYLHAAGSSGNPSTFSSPNTANYGHHNDDRLPMEPYGYPEPPPSYSELHTPQTPSMTPQTPSTESTPQDPPRTVVITSVAGPQLNQQPSGELPSPIGLTSPDRKVIYCPHCGFRVNTLVIWESGLATHVIAFVLLCLVLLPLIVLLYCTNFFKYRNHYCPNCNKKIGYELPALCIAMTYTK